MLACLVADLFWHQLGVRRGPSVLNLLCRITLEPDSCVRPKVRPLAGGFEAWRGHGFPLEALTPETGPTDVTASESAIGPQ